MQRFGQYPEGTKLIAESCGSYPEGREFIHEFLEYPDGTMESLGIRRAQSCLADHPSIVPLASPLALRPANRKRTHSVTSRHLRLEKV